MHTLLRVGLIIVVVAFTSGCGGSTSTPSGAGKEAMEGAVAEESIYPMIVRLHLEVFSDDSIISDEIGEECEIVFHATDEKNFVLTIEKDGKAIRTITRTPDAINDDQGVGHDMLKYWNLDSEDADPAFDWPVHIVKTYCYPMSSLAFRDRIKNLYASFERSAEVSNPDEANKITLSFSDPYSNMAYHRLYFDSAQSHRPIESQSMFDGQLLSQQTYSDFVAIKNGGTLPGVMKAERFDGDVKQRSYSLTLISHGN